MTLELIIRYFHFLGIFGVVASLFYEMLEVSSNLQRSKVIRMAKVDGLYGLCAIIVVGTGMLMWFVVGKPPDFYGSNWIFYTKIAVFSVVGLISIYPTVLIERVL